MSTTEDERHKNRIRENLKKTLTLLEKTIKSTDPSHIDPQIVLDYHTQQLRVKTLDNLTPADHITVLEKVEEWYKEKKLEYPYPEWLEQSKSFWRDSNK